jgi:hypothetical protein
MLQTIFRHIATLLEADPEIHLGDDSHALDPDDDDLDESW